MPLRPLRLSYQGSQYVKALEGFRGYGMTGVFLYHCVIYAPLRPWLNWVWFGVDLFFVVSGFLITGILLDTRGRPRALRDFYVRRVLRIFPIYYLTLAAVTLVLSVSDEPRSQRMLANMPWFWSYMQNYLIAFHGWSAMLSLGHFWSLAIEEQFYLVWPLLVTFVRSQRLLVFCLVAAVASFALRQIHIEFPFSYTFTFFRLEGLMVGASIAILIRSDRARLERWVPYTLPLSALGLALVAWTQRGFVLENEWVMRVGYPLMALFFGSLLVGTLDQGRLGRVVRRFSDSDTAVFVGRYSYGIYIFHWILHWHLRQPLYDWLAQRLPWALAASLAYLVIMAALTLGAAILSYHLLEKHFLRLKDVLAPRRA